MISRSPSLASTTHASRIHSASCRVLVLAIGHLALTLKRTRSMEHGMAGLVRQRYGDMRRSWLLEMSYLPPKPNEPYQAAIQYNLTSGRLARGGVDDYWLPPNQRPITYLSTSGPDAAFTLPAAFPVRRQ